MTEAERDIGPEEFTHSLPSPLDQHEILNDVELADQLGLDVQIVWDLRDILEKWAESGGQE